MNVQLPSSPSCNIMVMRFHSFQLISLKAELSRKQEEVIKAKAQAHAQFIHPVPRPKKQTLWIKTNAGVSERAEKDLEAEQEEEDAFKKSRCVCVHIKSLFFLGWG